MSYIGKIPATGNFVKLDAISVVNGQASYTMQSGSVNFTPESANHMLVSLNGVIQAPISSFTVSGSTITFASALSTGDVIDFIMVYGNVLDIGTPSDNTVTASKLTTDSVIEAKIQNDAVTRDKINAISTSSLPSFEAKGTSGVTEGYIQLNCAENSHGIKLKSPPHSAGQSYTLTFPSTAPATDKFLKTNSSGVLSFADVGGGDVVKLNETSHSSNVGTISIDGHHTSDYDIYDYIIDGFAVDTDSQAIKVRVNMGGSAKTTSDYKNAGYDSYSSSGSGNIGSNRDWNQSYFRPNANWGSPRNTSVRRGYLLVRLVNPLSTSQYKTGFYFNTYENHDNSQYVSQTGGWQYGASEGTAVSGLTFYLSSGNFTSYRIRVYGIK
mgnify:CR=1 FL=1|tara:strand:+ start:1008 stop:2153 length:1146 start_codon:yes stop_codon:yes gene_type:complete